ncbi:MAG: hypothetical protein PHF42_08400 [Pseudomonas sp.]|nr:hypothetical protein [Pseudomonas sp.]
MIELVVLGMHRSGTSAMAGVLSRTGFGVGASLLPANQHNPRGYFENKLLVDENNALLERLRSAWDDVRPLPLDALAQHLASSDNRVRYKALLETELSGSGGVDQGYVLKDPRLCRVLPLWQPVWQDLGWNPRYILMLRHPDEVVASLQHRDGMAPEHGYLLYVAYLLDAERYTRTCQRTVVLYEQLLNSPDIVWQKLTAEIQLPAVSPDRWTQAVELLTPELRHHQAVGSETLSLGQDLAYRLWAIMQRMQAQPSAQDSNMLEQLHADFLRYVNSIAPWLQQRNDLEAFKRDVLAGGDMYRKVMQSDAVIQLFWGESANALAEKQSIRLPLQFSSEQKEFYFCVPEEGFKNIKTIRLDLSDRPFFAKISELELLDQERKCVWRWDRNSGSLFYKNNTIELFDAVESLNEVYVSSSHHDPQAILDIPLDVLAQITPGYCFRLVASIDLPTAGLNSLLGLIRHYEQISHDFQCKLNSSTDDSLVSEVDSLSLPEVSIHDKLGQLQRVVLQFLQNQNKKILMQESKIDLLQQREQAFSEEMQRAEHQLELLKSLLDN